MLDRMRVWPLSGLRLVLLAASIGLVTACSSSEGGMDIIHVDRPLWYPASQLTTFIYLFAAMPLTRRSSDARIVAGLPIIGNAVVAFAATALAACLLWIAGDRLMAVGVDGGNPTAIPH